MILWFYLFFLCSVFWVVVVFIYIVYFGYCVGSLVFAKDVENMRHMQSTCTHTCYSLIDIT